MEMDRNLFPLMPGETFDIWLKPHIDVYGSLAGEVNDPRWEKELREHSVSFWSKVGWRKTEVELSDFPIEARALDLAEELAGRFAHFEKTGFWSPTGVVDSLQRMSQLVQYIRENNKFPEALVCLETKTDWLLIDGQHRLAASYLVRKKHSGKCLIWLGRDGT